MVGEGFTIMISNILSYQAALMLKDAFDNLSQGVKVFRIGPCQGSIS